MIQRLNIKIYGRVQMVGFRYSTKMKAKNLGINGWVRNEEDGTVYIEAEGEKAVLERFLVWCHKGQLWAKIEKVEYEYKDEIKNYQDFIIKY